jgi:hypothetical protein
LTIAQNRQARAAQYLVLSGEPEALMEASDLPHVREKHERAAATWKALAEMDGRPSTRPTPTP